MRNFGAIILVLILAMAVPAAAADLAATISVTGEGSFETVPDMASVSLGVTTEDRNAATALAANSTRLAGVIARLKQAGIEDRDIQTSGLSLGPQYDYNNANGGAPKITGYIASNTVTVRVRALDRIGGVLDGVVSEGANTLNSLWFGLQDPATAIDEARRRAIADARHRATLYAEAAGVTLGPVLSISEPGAVPHPMALEMASGYAKSADVPVASGELNITTSVNVVYLIAD